MAIPPWLLVVLVGDPIEHRPCQDGQAAAEYGETQVFWVSAGEVDQQKALEYFPYGKLQDRLAALVFWPNH
jgi:hypothetical protein